MYWDGSVSIGPAVLAHLPICGRKVRVSGRKTLSWMKSVLSRVQSAVLTSVGCADFVRLCRLRAAVPTSCGCADFVRLCRLHAAVPTSRGCADFDFIFGANALPFEIKEGCWNFRFKWET